MGVFLPQQKDLAMRFCGLIRILNTQAGCFYIRLMNLKGGRVMINTETQPRLLRVQEASKYLAISERTLWNLTKNDCIKAVRIGRAVRYDISDLDSFIAAAKRAQ